MNNYTYICKMINKNEFILLHIPDATVFSIKWKFELYQGMVGKNFQHGEQTKLFKEIAEKNLKENNLICWKTIKRYRNSDLFKDLLEATSKVSCE